MIEKRPQADRILVAQLTGEARRRARWRELSSNEEAAAVTALRELAGGRADLLAEVAGILEGAGEGELKEPLVRQAAMLCRRAGADPEAIVAWIEEGRRRKAVASMPPFSGGLYGRGTRRPVLKRYRASLQVVSPGGMANRMIIRGEGTRYLVRLSVPRRGGVRTWGSRQRRLRAAPQRAGKPGGHRRAHRL